MTTKLHVRDAFSVLTQPVLENYTPPAPITAPIMAPLGADPQAQPVSSGAPQATVQGQHGAQVPYSGMHQQQFAPPAVNQVMPNTSVEGAPGAPTGDVIQVENSDRLLICKPQIKFNALNKNAFGFPSTLSSCKKSLLLFLFCPVKSVSS